MTTNKLLLQLKSFLFRYFVRDNNLIAVFSAHNNFTGNCKYAVMAIQKKFPEKRIIWFVANENEQKQLQKFGVVTGIM